MQNRRRTVAEWFDRVVRLGWVRSPQSINVRFGTGRAGAVDVALYTMGSINALLSGHPEVGWEQLRTVKKGRYSSLAALRLEPAPVPAYASEVLTPARVPRRPRGRPGARAFSLRAAHACPAAGSHRDRARPVPSPWKHRPRPGVLRAPMVPTAWRKSRARPLVCTSWIGSLCRLPSVTPSATPGLVKWACMPPVIARSVSFSSCIVSVALSMAKSSVSRAVREALPAPEIDGSGQWLGADR